MEEAARSRRPSVTIPIGQISSHASKPRLEQRTQPEVFKCELVPRRILDLALEQRSNKRTWPAAHLFDYLDPIVLLFGVPLLLNLLYFVVRNFPDRLTVLVLVEHD